MKNIEEEVNYCLNCKTRPCKNGCPLENDIPKVISLMKSKNYKEAYEVLTQTTVLPSVCGRICPYFTQCQENCIRGKIGIPVNIGSIESYLGDLAIEKGYKIPMLSLEDNSEKKIAIIGAGPSGVTCGAFLARNGFSVTIYEKHNQLGGILEHGVPEFRLSKKTVKKSIDKILELGIKVKYNQELGKNIKLEELINDYDAIFLSFGANCSLKMGIEGEDLKGVFGANELLEYPSNNLYKNKDVAIVGGGNVAIDTARIIKKMDAKSVTIIYRRSEEEMPANKVEIENAKKDKINFLFQTNVLKILSDENGKYVRKIECIKTKLIEEENKGRLIPINIDDSNFEKNIDIIIMAVGSKVQDEVIEKLGLEKNKYNYIKVNENYITSRDKVFAGGDLIGEKATVAWAAKSGRQAANNIIKYLKEKKES